MVAYLPNLAEAAIGFLATASIGAIWSSASPDFGAGSLIDRFAQIEPTVLLAVSSYGFRNRDIDRRDEVQAIRAGLPTLEVHGQKFRDIATEESV